MVTTSRRTIVKGIAAGSGSLLMPMPFIRPAQAASARDTLVQAHSEPVTGNWDPTSHTILPQHYMELLVMGQLFRMPLRHEDPSAVVWELATGQKLIDFYTLEYALRDDVKFHDGKPFSAEDVKATFEYASQRNKTAPWYPGVCEVEVVDRLTARVHTKTGGFPASAFFLLGSFLPIMSKADVDDPARLKQRLNGTGPFKFVEQQGDTTVLVANEDHLGGPPILKHIRFPWIADSTTRMLGLLSGEIDITEKMEPEQYTSLLNDKRVKLTSTMAAENMNLAFRTNKAPTDNPLVRLAIAHAIDRSEILNLVGPAGKECETFLPAVKFGSERSQLSEVRSAEVPGPPCASGLPRRDRDARIAVLDVHGPLVKDQRIFGVDRRSAAGAGHSLQAHRYGDLGIPDIAVPEARPGAGRPFDRSRVQHGFGRTKLILADDVLFNGQSGGRHIQRLQGPRDRRRHRRGDQRDRS
jgi:peptide/nickel transport system substrate-binding protein